LKRKRLSGKIITEKIIAMVLVGGILLLCFKTSADLLLIGVPIAIALDYMVFYLPSHVEFDDERIFIRKKSAPELVVSLNNITLVKAMHWSIGFHTLFKITYWINGKQMRIYLYPRAFSSILPDFVNQLKTKNGSVEIKGF
jgi:hypothetical protein